MFAQRLMEDLVVTSTTPTYSTPVPLGNDNCAMLEAWIKSGVGGATVHWTIEGSNDLSSWSAISGFTTLSGNSIPVYGRSAAFFTVITWAYLRIKVWLTGGTTPAMLVDADLRTFTTTG